MEKKTIKIKEQSELYSQIINCPRMMIYTADDIKYQRHCLISIMPIKYLAG